MSEEYKKDNLINSVKEFFLWMKSAKYTNFKKNDYISLILNQDNFEYCIKITCENVKCSYKKKEEKDYDYDLPFQGLPCSETFSHIMSLIVDNELKGYKPLVE